MHSDNKYIHSLEQANRPTTEDEKWIIHTAASKSDVIILILRPDGHIMWLTFGLSLRASECP